MRAAAMAAATGAAVMVVTAAAATAAAAAVGAATGGARGSAPAREFAETPRDPDAKPYAPKVTEHIHDGDDFAFGKIEL